jgi:hypothetical protein
MREQDQVNRARIIGSVIGIALVLVALAWKLVIH